MKLSKFYEIYEKTDRKRKLFTKSLTPGKRVYGENLVRKRGEEFREWDPRRSKASAAILKGLNQFGLKQGFTVLYLGCSTGTTVSHFSDIVGKSGFIFALDFAPRVMRDMVYVCEDRPNIAPIMADANQPETYADKVCQVDYLYMDIAQKNQVQIFLKNIDLFLKNGGYCLLAVKARSIDVTANPRTLFKEVRRKLDEELIIVDYRELDPFEKDHAMFVCKKK